MPAESGSAPTRGAWLREFWNSSIGKKQIVAVTGAVLVLYVISHMFGNLKVFQGPGNESGSIDAYAEFLRTVGEPVIPREGLLWVARVFLLGAFVTTSSPCGNSPRETVRPSPRGARAPVIKRSLSARTMQVGGLFLLVFVIFHILQFTTGTINPGEFTQGAVYDNLDQAFQHPIFVVIYVAAVTTLGFHLRHAVWSFFQTGGWDKPNRNPTFRRMANVIAIGVAVGFMAVPIAFWTGAIGGWRACRSGPVDRLDSRIPEGPLQDKWQTWLDAHRLVGPRQRADHRVIVVGTGLAGASAAATLAGQGYTVDAFCFQDSARRAHSIAAQGGINATKDYANEGDSVQRLFVDTIKGGDFRAREANVWRLAETSTNIIDQAVAQGVPFNREYGGMLATRSFGGVLVERTFYCRGQTGQQLLLGAYSALQRQVAEGTATVHNRHELLDIVIVDGQARGIIARNLITGEIERHAADAVVLATGGYCNVYYLSTNAMGCNVTAAWRAHRRGAAFANPCFTQIHPTSIPATGHYQSKLTLMSESLRNDGRVWVPRDPAEVREPADIPDAERYYYLEERYPRFGNLVPRDVASRAAKIVCDDGLGVGGTGRAVYLDFRDAISERGADVIADRYGNLFEMYERITGDSPWKTPMMIYPAPHYSMGGLWVDYELQSTIPGLFAIGEANFSDHGANRLGASAMMQCLADGYFIAPHTVTNFVSGVSDHVPTDHPAFESAEEDVRGRIDRLLDVGGKTPHTVFHRELGEVMLDHCGITREADGLRQAMRRISELRDEFWSDLRIEPGEAGINQTLEYAGRIADFLELAELMCRDALIREESCGCHLREEHQTDEGEAVRDDDGHANVQVWEWKGEGEEPEMQLEKLEFESIELATRSYK